MKVKKKYLFIIGSIFILAFAIVIGISFYLLSRYNLTIEEGSRIIANGFSMNPADREDIKEHSTKNQKFIDVLHYELYLDLFPSEKKIQGKSKIKGVVNPEFQNSIDLNFNDGFEISEILFNGNKTEYNYSDEKITIPIILEPKDTFEIEISYSGSPESRGFGSFTFGEYDEESVVYSLNEPIFASTWFPCNDIPSDKVLTDLYITNDSSMTSVSNGILISTEIVDDRKTYHWKTVYPISTYLISVYSANYMHYQDEYISKNTDTMMIDYYVFEDHFDKSKKDFSIHPIAIKHFAELFGEYPFIKEKYGVAEFLWSFGAMEHQTITGIGERFIGGNQFFTGMLVHELAHQWWGNAVTLSSWEDIWLNEGFATYSEALYWEKENGFSALKSKMRSFLTNFKGTKLYNPEELFSRIIYNKGAWVLHMLRKELGDDIFFSLLKNYYQEYKYKNASSNDFVQLVEKVSDRDFTQFFNQWVFDGEGKIELEYKYNQNVSHSQFEIEIFFSQVQDGYENYSFILDLDFYLENGTKKREFIQIDTKTSKQHFKFTKRVTKIDLDPDNWLAANIKFLDSNIK